MQRQVLLMTTLLPALLVGTGCPGPGEERGRQDSAVQLHINVSGSLQNPAWSPDSAELLFTVFRGGYNRGSADLLVVNTSTTATRVLVSDGSGNINLPGASWNPVTNQVVFASTRPPHDEVFVIDADANPGTEQRITSREGLVAYEPSLSPDGRWVVFESHVLDMEDNGVITKFRMDGTGSFIPLTDADTDCRQPNWSPQGDLIVYQRVVEQQWDLWVMNSDGTNHRLVTTGPGDKTDASFSPDGQRIIYSADQGELDGANLFVIPVAGGAPARVTHQDGYDGAPSWSPDGTRIAFESSPGDPDDYGGTTLWVIDAP